MDKLPLIEAKVNEAVRHMDRMGPISMGLRPGDLKLSVEEVAAKFLTWELPYADSIRKNLIDGDMLIDLSDADLIKLGMENKFHSRNFRKKLQVITEKAQNLKRYSEFLKSGMKAQSLRELRLQHDISRVDHDEMVSHIDDLRLEAAEEKFFEETRFKMNESYPILSLSDYNDDGNCLFINTEYPGLQAISAAPGGNWVFVVNGLLSPEECEYLQLVGGTTMRASESSQGEGTAEVDTEKRFAYESLLDPKVAGDIQAKFSKLLNAPTSNFEALKITQYPEGGKFNRHDDALHPSATGQNYCPTPWANRIATLIVYLTDASGGETRFNDLNRNDKPFKLTDDPKTIDVQPKRGMGLIFFPAYLPTATDEKSADLQINVAKGNQNYRVYHEALKTLDDKKWIAQQWVWPGTYDLQKAKWWKKPYSWPEAQAQYEDSLKPKK